MIGSAGLAESFATAAISATFIVVVGVSLWPAILGLVPGGMLAALVVRRLPGRPLMAVVGAAVSLLALRSLLSAQKPGGG